MKDSVDPRLASASKKSSPLPKLAPTYGATFGHRTTVGDSCSHGGPMNGGVVPVVKPPGPPTTYEWPEASPLIVIESAAGEPMTVKPPLENPGDEAWVKTVGWGSAAATDGGSDSASITAITAATVETTARRFGAPRRLTWL